MLPLVLPVLSAEISGLIRLRRAGESGAQCTVVQCCVHGPRIRMSATTNVLAETGPDAAAQDGVDRRRPPRRTHVGLDLGERISAVEGRRGPGRAGPRAATVHAPTSVTAPARAQHPSDELARPPTRLHGCFAHTVFLVMSPKQSRELRHMALRRHRWTPTRDGTSAYRLRWTRDGIPRHVT